MSGGFEPYTGEIKPIAATKEAPKFEPYTGEVTDKPSEPTMPWADVGAGALQNLGPSALHAAEGIVQPFLHPIDTATGLKDIAYGATSKMREGIRGLFGAEPETVRDPERQRADKALSSLATFYKDRYGSMEGFKKALAEDPVGVAMDIGTVLSAGELAGAKIPGLAKLADPARLGQGAAKAGKLAEAATSETLGHLTGGGAESVRQAVKAGFNKEMEFIDALDGKIPLEQTVKLAAQGVQNMRKKASADYQTLMQTVKADPTVLD